ncbi:MAG: class I SAM-dependent methyltransferase [Prevotella sp.]|nr:class I SAM-dependent methyltransferase [Prevotella sp.]
MTEELERYVREHSAPESDYLYRLWRDTNVRTLHGRMTSGHLQGRLLKMLVMMIRPQRVLEVGTFSGYSALCLAEGLSQLAKDYPDELADAHLWTIEKNDEMEDFARPWIENSPYGDRITFMIGDANDVVPQLDMTFDLAFIDGDKRTYVETYETVLKQIRPGGFILADNTLWDGHVVDAAYDHDPQTVGICQFNDHLLQDNRVEQVLLPLRDGLTLIRKRLSNDLSL